MLERPWGRRCQADTPTLPRWRWSRSCCMGRARSDPLVSSLRKFVWMIVAIAVTVLLAPMTASAHEGHHPAAAIHEAAPHGALVEHFQEVGTAQAYAGSVAQAGLCAPTPDVFCGDGCCGGMACCFVAILSAAPGLDPPV